MSRIHYNALESHQANQVALSPNAFIESTAHSFPEREAIIYGARRYSWSDVLKRSRRLASSLMQQGVEVGDTVSVLMPNIPEMVEAHFAIPMTGAVINTINTRLDRRTISYILSHADSQWLIVDAQFIELINEIIESESLGVKVIRVDDAQAGVSGGKSDFEYNAFLEQGSEQAFAARVNDEWQALSLSYTSGTSGKPKGVVYHHRGAYLMSLGTVAAWQLPMHPTYLYTVPLFHCNGWGHAWTVCLMAGTIVCCRNISAKNVFDAVEAHKVTHFGAAPIVLGLLVNADPSEQKPFSHEVNVMTAGAPPPASVLEKTEALGFNVMQVYGLTESHGHIMYCHWQSDWDQLDAKEQAQRKSYQGIALPTTEAVGLLKADGTMVDRFNPQGESGEIVIRGNTVMKGYYKDPEGTDAAFRGGWFHSEDVATYAEAGYVQIKDRMKDIIISGGENISSIEVESILYQHPAVANAAVVAAADEKWGEVPCAFIELKTGVSVQADELKAYCRTHLSGFKVPKHIRFESLPKTSTGKIQKFKLKALLAEDS